MHVLQIYGYSLLLFAVLISRATAEQQIRFKTLENDEVLNVDSSITIANVSDVFIDIQCIVLSTTDEILVPQPMKEWSLHTESSGPDSEILFPLDASNTSYNSDDGILRIYSTFISEHALSGVLRLQCSTTSDTAAGTIKIHLSPTLFYDGTIPSEISSSDNLHPLCVASLPSFPTVSSVTVHNGITADNISFTYCETNSARGMYWSRSVPIDITDMLSLLQFLTAFPSQVEEWASEDDSGDIRLTCQITGVARRLPTVYFIKDGNRIPASTDRTPFDNNSVYISETGTLTRRTLVIGKMRGNEGVYQCVGQGGEDRSTAVTSSTYINIKYLEQPVITVSSTSTSWTSDAPIIIGQPDSPSEIVLNCSVDAHPIPRVTWTSRNFIQDIYNQQAITEFRETAFSELHVPVTTLVGHVEFICTVVLEDRVESTSTDITAYSRVVFTKLPSLTASLSTPNSVAITCSTKSTPVAEITWFFVQNSGITTQLINSSETLITSEQVGGGVMSTLQISPIEDLSIAGLFCRGNNGFLQSESKVLDTSRSVPTKPNVTVDDITPYSVRVAWTHSLSIIALKNYTVTIKQQQQHDEITFEVSETQTFNADGSTEFKKLKPYINYRVVVTVYDKVGNQQSAFTEFETLQTAPTAPPQAVRAEAYDTNTLRISWQPPLRDFQNGVIQKYHILYHPISEPGSLYHSSSESPNDDEVLLESLGEGVRYNISVAAETVEIGPYSKGIIQQTYPRPPAFISGPPIIVPGFDATENTIPVQLPAINITQFSHFWVVAARLDSSGDTQSLSLTEIEIPSVSSDTPVNEPYVVSEISAFNYSQTRLLFVLGDENSSQPFNDKSNIYHNPPLIPGEQYTLFVRGFLPYIPSNPIQESSEATRRQYVVFSNSDLLPVTKTLTLGSDSSSSAVNNIPVYVSIGVGCLLVIAVVIVIIIVQRKLRMIGKKYTENGTEQNISQGQVPADGTLPRGLTVTGEGMKHEEHVYEDPLYLKHSEAYSAPIYRIPPPITNEHTSRKEECDEAGYEIIDYAIKAKKPKSNRTSGVIVATNPKYECSSVPKTPNTTVGYYEVMHHPSSLGKEAVIVGSPAPYLTPVGVLDTQPGIPAGYSLVGVNEESEPTTESVNSKTIPSVKQYATQEDSTVFNSDHEVMGNTASTTGYANIVSEDKIESKTINKPPRAGQEEYISMQSATTEQ